mgnify:CR=1 FL=1
MSLLHETQFARNADRAVERAGQLLHPNALEQLKANMDKARAWLMDRQRAIVEQRGTLTEAFRVDVNRWNEFGYGLQSLVMDARDLDDQESLLLSDAKMEERKSPTLGLPANGMLQGYAVVGEAEFPLKLYEGDEIENLGSHPLLIRRVEAGLGRTWPGSENVLRPGPENRFIAWGTNQAIRATLEMTQAPKRTLAVEEVREQIGGIYACRLVRRKPNREAGIAVAS